MINIKWLNGLHESKKYSYKKKYFFKSSFCQSNNNLLNLSLEKKTLYLVLSETIISIVH